MNKLLLTICFFAFSFMLSYADNNKDSEGFKYISSYTYVKDISDYVQNGGSSYFTNCTQHESNSSILKANYFIVENFYGLNEGQSYAHMNMYGGNSNTGISKIGEFNFCQAWYRLSITDSNGNKDTQSFDFVKAYNNMSVGDYVRLKANNGITYTFTYIGKIKSDTNAEKSVGFVCDHPLYFGGNSNGSVGIQNFSNRVQIGYVEYYNYVDLGLPSGTLWCNKNIGAYNMYAEGIGFAWGETEEKNTYSWSNYKYYNGSNLTKYCSKSEQGIVDNKYVLDLEDDAATVNCGSEWCMPTVEQWVELKQYCQGQYISNSNGRGWKFTGPNGNSIFIPCFNDKQLGAYWSSSLSEKDNLVAYNVDFDYGGFYIDDSKATTRMMSQLVRPVLRTKNIIINQTNFPDTNFRAFIRDQSYGNDGVLTVAEISAIKELQLGEKQISNLKGIEFFTKLTHLYCYNNNLTNLDVSKNPALKVLSCGQNKLTKLDVSKNTELIWLNCSNNSLGQLDISKNSKLTFLCCHNCNLTSIDVTKNTLLETFEPSKNHLSTLNISKNTALKKLYCHINQLSTLDISKNYQLQVLSCYSNKLNKLDVSNNPMTDNIMCHSNQLTELNLSNNTNLKFLNCESNKLTALDVSKNIALETLYCDINQLTHLDVSNNKALIDLACYANQIKGTAMDKLINSLPEQPYAEFNVYYPYEEEGNICTKEQAYRAKQKGWLVLYWNNGKWEEYEGCDPSTIESISIDKTAISDVYTFDGKQVNSLHKGLNIIKMKDGTTRKIVVK